MGEVPDDRATRSEAPNRLNDGSELDSCDLEIHNDQRDLLAGQRISEGVRRLDDPGFDTSLSGGSSDSGTEDHVLDEGDHAGHAVIVVPSQAVHETSARRAAVDTEKWPEEPSGLLYRVAGAI